MGENNVSVKKERQIGLDIIRALAIIFVFITHGISYKGLLDQKVLTRRVECNFDIKVYCS